MSSFLYYLGCNRQKFWLCSKSACNISFKRQVWLYWTEKLGGCEISTHYFSYLQDGIPTRLEEDLVDSRGHWQMGTVLLEPLIS